MTAQAVSPEQLASGSGRFAIGTPHTLKIDEVGFNFDSGYRRAQIVGGAPEFGFVMSCLGEFVIGEARETPISTAVGMQHQNDAPRIVQTYRCADLSQYEFAIVFVPGRSQGFCSTGHLNGIGIHHTVALQKLPEGHFETTIEAPHHRGIALIVLPRSVEMKDLFHRGSCFYYPRTAVESHNQSRSDEPLQHASRGDSKIFYVDTHHPGLRKVHLHLRYSKQVGAEHTE